MITPTQNFYRHAVRSPRKLSTGIDKGVDALIGRMKRRSAHVRKLKRDAQKVRKIFDGELAGLTREELSGEIQKLYGQLRGRKKSSAALKLRGLACAAAASKEVLGMVPYQEQLMGALAVEEGLFAEMATGEGKTLTIALAGIVAGWQGQPCHIITANDYLAERDAETMQTLYRFCGLRAGHVIGTHTPSDRKLQYQAPVVYTTSQQLLADFLRDRLSLGSDFTPAQRLMHALVQEEDAPEQELVLRGLHTAIIDEGDNVLIDEAVTPLVISRTYANAPFTACCTIARELALSLMQGRDFQLDRKRKDIRLTPTGEEVVQRHSHRMPPVWRSHDRRNELVVTALVAEHFFIQDTHFVVTDEGKIEIIDEFTGRILPGRTWKQGLHQAVEAKCGLEITDPAETMASMSFQRFFRMFQRLSAFSGTAQESAGELWHIYRLPTVKIPTHRPVIRKEQPAQTYFTREEKFAAMVEEAKGMACEGRSVLIGTRTVSDSERLAELFAQSKICPQVLNAVRHEEEAQIVSRAGEAGMVTIATNMAGRGTDIHVPEAVLLKGGLHVMMAECNASGRIDRQLLGRTGRQGNPGTYRQFHSLEDELFQRFLPKLQRARISAAMKGGLPGARGLLLKSIDRAQALSEKGGVKQRRTVLQMDSWLDEQLSFTRPESRI
ncbi:DEAD/DEAH box helicase [Kiritimatiellaeota bacterium B1221]|nr:DEAD/DEAH box helicase [Kiritimatiellaeota bacterium B1221]